jgi:hypothetical protein
MVLAAAAAGISVGIGLGWLVYMNFQDIEESKATETRNSAAGAGDGEILCEFTWEKEPVTAATLGPDGISAGPDAHCARNGSGFTLGLAPGKRGKGIDLVLESNELFDQDGIDIRIDYRGGEKDGYFISRGINFYFGVEDGFLSASYRVEGEKGEASVIKAKTDYEILQDDEFRTYGFSYSPVTGKCELTVNGVPVWSRQGTPQRAMYWKNAGRVMIGKNLDGNGRDIALLDNLVIRSNGNLNPLAESLLNFMVETANGKARIHFTVMDEALVSSFTVERSEDGFKFSKLNSFPPGSQFKSEDEYVLSDESATEASVIYYRLRQDFRNGKHVIHPVSAVRMKSDKKFSIERVNPTIFTSNFSISYFLPASGRVWIQLQDSQGKVVGSKTFEAREGKNVYTYYDEGKLVAGTYTINLMHNNRKASVQIIKS